MTDAPVELRETWESKDGRVVGAGDSAIIKEWLATKLIKIKIDRKYGAWRVLYRHCETGEFWELTYPHSGWHGGGPRLLRRLNIGAPEQWTDT
jgi:Immunity protein 27